MRTTVSVATNIQRSARVAQVEGIFDVPPTKQVQLKWDVDLPIDVECRDIESDHDPKHCVTCKRRSWNVGLIVGPSGCGKSSVARQMFGEQMARHDALTKDWKKGSSLLDSFPADMGIKDIVAVLSSVGFSSPPAWVRPFEVLSNGEQFRVMMARVLAEARGQDIAVVDEFTSVVDRTVAQIGSSAIAKAVRRNGQRFVAVTCHEDVEPWLQPDWVYRPAEQRFAWRSVQPRPPITLRVYRTHHSAWRYFAHHHYLTHELNKAAFCFVAFADFPGIGERLVAFDAWLPFFGKLKPVPGIVGGRRGHRTVCLPDYQGVGIGNALFSFLARMWCGLGYRAFSGTAHPAEIAARKRNPNWKMTRAPGFTAKGKHGIDAKRASNRLMASFEWVGDGMPKVDAQRILDVTVKV